MTRIPELITRSGEAVFGWLDRYAAHPGWNPSDSDVVFDESLSRRIKRESLIGRMGAAITALAGRNELTMATPEAESRDSIPIVASRLTIIVAESAEELARVPDEIVLGTIARNNAII
ncbi:MAG: hypothetical protein JWL85_876, partial [Candidatus Saccharibacteria bacterium]|nr:hypothetical protein [Candidatus Saccharibacteria bacterium]